jgi:hypothetical protein
MSVVFLTVPAEMRLAGWATAIRRRAAAAGDARLKDLHDLLVGIRFVKVPDGGAQPHLCFACYLLFICLHSCAISLALVKY